MKPKIHEEYICQMKKLCQTKLNGGNLVLGINAWAVEVVLYGAGIVERTKVFG